MFMRIAWGRIKPGHWNDYEAAYTEGHRDEKAAGLKARYLIQDAQQPDLGFSITLWESEEDLHRYETDSVRKDRLPLIRDHFTGDFNVQHCRVKFAKTFD